MAGIIGAPLELKLRLSSSLVWAVFGRQAVAFHFGLLHGPHTDIRLIVRRNADRLEKLLDG